MNIDVTCWKCNTEHLIFVEMLMSGTCGECFDKLFPDQDEDIEEEF